MLARQTGYSVLFQSDEVKSAQTNALSGRYTVERALKYMLAGTDLSYGLTDGNMISIMRSHDEKTPDLEGEGKVLNGKSKRGGLLKLLSGVSATVMGSVGVANAQDDNTGLSDAEKARAASRSDTIIVTAQKREESLQEVPLSITAFGEYELERRGISDFSEYARLVPGLAFTDQGAGATSFFIRGVSSPSGNPTTQFYIDDMPQLSSNAGSSIVKGANPAVFDVSRVEILRGPQGTLFGASAMGGLIRVITNQPDASGYSASTAADFFLTQDGGESIALNGMVNAPLIEDVLAVRLVGVFREEAGFIDRVPDSALTFGSDLVPDPEARAFVFRERDIDGEKQHAARLSALFTPNDDLSMRATVFWQDIEEDNRHVIDDVRGGKIERGGVVDEPRRDRFTQYNFMLDYRFGAFDFVSSTSYLDRDVSEQTDFTFLGDRVFGTTFPYINERVNPYTAFTTEARLQTAGTGPLDFTLGVFYLDFEGGENQLVYAPGFTDETGIGSLPGDVLFDEFTVATEQRFAVFGQASYHLFDRLELIAGFRWFDVELGFLSLKDGLFNGGPSETDRDITETGWTPKAALKYDLGDNKQIYASASKGFRVGEPNLFVPQAACGADLAAIGFSEPPELIESDSLWQYELGTKIITSDGRLSVNAAVYYTDWTGIPQTVPLDCGFSVSLNVGEASTKGFEIELWSQPVEGLDLSAAIGFSDASLELDAPDVGGMAGDRLQQVPRWTVAFSGQYSFPIFGTRTGYVRGDFSYIGDSFTSFEFDNPDDRRPAYDIADFAVGVVGDSWEGALYIDNAFNETAVFGVSTTDVNELTINRPRTYGVRFKKFWN